MEVCVRFLAAEMCLRIGGRVLGWGWKAKRRWGLRMWRFDHLMGRIQAWALALMKFWTILRGVGVVLEG